MKIVVTRSETHGPQLPAEGFSLLFGVPVKEIRAHAAGQDGPYVALQPEWVRHGRRRAREALAKTGRDDLASSLRYWAMKDHGAELVIEHSDAPSGL